MRIIDPATDQILEELSEDTAETVREKAARSRAAQPAWAARPLAERAAIVRRFRDLILERKDALAATLTSEVGKPITQSHNEIAGTIRASTSSWTASPRSSHTKSCSRRPEMEERISHEPLGVIANISAWNYPYFVGSNVFVPALLTGNTVLYKRVSFPP